MSDHLLRSPGVVSEELSDYRNAHLPIDRRVADLLGRMTIQEKVARLSATGFVFAGIVFALKAGLGLGGPICGWLLSVYGYIPNVVQTEGALFGIRMSASIYPAITFLIGVIALSFYGISRELNLQIQNALQERRRNFESI